MKAQEKGAIRTGFWILAIFLGALQSAANWPQLSSTDAISYLDIGDAYFRGDWEHAINASWSPLYSWCLGFALFIIQPSPYWEFAVVKAVTFLLFLFCVAGFDFFLRQFIRHNSEKSSIPERVWLVSGYTLFLWASLVWTGTDTTTPDMIASGLLFVAAGILIDKATLLKSAALGSVLGLGYLAKAPVLPVAFIFLAAFYVRNGFLKTLFAAIFLIAVVGPFVTLLSIQKGHFTFGEKGKLSYAWFVNPKLPDLHWQGGKHPTRMIQADPPLYEFATPVNGTYPPWYDPSYWYEGVSFEFDAGRQIHSIFRNMFFLWSQFLGMLCAGYFILLWMSGNTRSSLRDLVKDGNLFYPALAGLLLYSVVSDMQAAYFERQPNTRHFAPYALLLFASLFGTLRLATSEEAKRVVTASSFVFCALVLISLSYRGVQDLVMVLQQPEHISWKIADGAGQLGISAGDQIATIGKESDHVHWARLSRVKMIAEVPYRGAITNLNQSIKTLQTTGARAIVTRPDTFRLPSPWKQIGDTGYYVYFLK